MLLNATVKIMSKEISFLLTTFQKLVSTILLLQDYFIYIFYYNFLIFFKVFFYYYALWGFQLRERLKERDTLS